jgi:hypothetical protein
LNCFGAILKSFERKEKIEKGKIIEQKKVKEGLGQPFGPKPETAHGPTRPNPTWYLAPSHSLTDMWTPPVRPPQHHIPSAEISARDLRAMTPPSLFNSVDCLPYSSGACAYK